VLLAAVGAIAELVLHPFGSGTSTARIAATPTPAVAPAPAPSWQFPAGSKPSDQTTVVVNNPGNSAAKITVSVGGAVQQVTLPPQGESEMDVAPQNRARAITVTSSAPIIVERIDVRQGKTYTSYGRHA
jgi:hypothetical protein